MEKTIALLKEEVGKKEYQEIIERIGYLQKAKAIWGFEGTKCKEISRKQGVLADTIGSIFSEKGSNVISTFIKEFEEKGKAEELFIKLAEEIIPSEYVHGEESLIPRGIVGELMNQSVEYLFSEKGEINSFLVSVAKSSEQVNAALSENEELYKKLLKDTKR